MRDFTTLARHRASVRNFTSRSVTDAEITTIMEAARLAPTACNRQPFRFLVVRDRAKLDLICSAYQGTWLATAPCIIIAICLPAQGWVRRHDRKNLAEVDLAIAVDHLTLAAADIGLGTCWICAFDDVAIAPAFGLTQEEVLLALVPVGQPAETAGPKERKPLTDLFILLD